MISKEEFKKAGLFMPYWAQRYNPELGDERAFDLTEQYISTLITYHEIGRGVIFVGEPGTGKTLLAHHIAESVIEHEHFSLKAITMVGYQELVLAQMSYMDLVKSMHDRDAQEKWWKGQALLERLRSRYDFVLLDDIGKEHSTSTGYAEYSFDRLIRARGNKGLPTIMTTNVPVAEWSAAYGESMDSYLHQVCQIIPVITSDFRRR